METSNLTSMLIIVKVVKSNNWLCERLKVWCCLISYPVLGAARWSTWTCPSKNNLLPVVGFICWKCFWSISRRTTVFLKWLARPLAGGCYENASVKIWVNIEASKQRSHVIFHTSVRKCHICFDFKSVFKLSAPAFHCRVWAFWLDVLMKTKTEENAN